MSDEPRLVIEEDGVETGHITASGTVEYHGEDEYVEGVLDRFKGGAVSVTRTATGEDGIPDGTEVHTSSGTSLFDQVAARLEPFDDITLRRHGEQELE